MIAQENIIIFHYWGYIIAFIIGSIIGYFTRLILTEDKTPKNFRR